MQIKQKRAKRIIETQIAKKKNLVARKFEHMSYEHQKRLRLHQKSIFHQRFTKSDMPANFWASKQTTSPNRKENKQLYQKHNQLVELIASAVAVDDTNAG